MYVLQKGRAESVLRDLQAMSLDLIEDLTGKKADEVEGRPLQGVQVRMRGIGLETMTDYSAVMTANAAATVDEGAEALKARRLEVIAAKRRWVSECFAEVVGLVDEQGEPIAVGNGKDALCDDALDVLDAADLIDELAAVARHWVGLPSAKKKLCGSRAP